MERQKQFTADMKHIYTAVNKQVTQLALKYFAEKWESKYGYAIKSWKDNWDELTVLFDFPLEIRKIIYSLSLLVKKLTSIQKYAPCR